ncbi:MAG: rhodanese-like domain-containing protein [Turicibacter sp.]|nr:rhodanese-like domain-containing protein [Turicibacter sp.]
MPRSISIAQLNQIMNTNPKIIDVRDPYQFAQYHLKTAVNIPYQTLVMYPERYLNFQDIYYLICAHGGESYRACTMLEPYGYKVMSIAGGYTSMRSNMRYRY